MKEGANPTEQIRWAAEVFHYRIEKYSIEARRLLQEIIEDDRLATPQERKAAAELLTSKRADDSAI
jgi:hypothetical protein